MVIVEIVEGLISQIKKKFNKIEANKILDLIESAKTNPKKGKLLGQVGGIIIKELKYKSFRIYFIADGFKLKFLSSEQLEDILLRFIRMSNKKYQQETINEIKEILIKKGTKGFE